MRALQPRHGAVAARGRRPAAPTPSFAQRTGAWGPASPAGDGCARAAVTARQSARRSATGSQLGTAEQGGPIGRGPEADVAIEAQARLAGPRRDGREAGRRTCRVTGGDAAVHG